MSIRHNLFKHKFSTNCVVLLSGLFLCTMSKCEKIPTVQTSKVTGGIYGALQMNDHTTPIVATVYIEGTDLFSKPDSTGIFYFPEVVPGNYTVIGRAEEFADYIVESVEIHEDSISIVTMFSLLKQPFPEKRTWDGMKIKRIDVRLKGSMTGKVDDYYKPIPNANVCLQGTIWGAATDSTGNYYAKGILPGRYIAFAVVMPYHRTVIYNIRIAPDSTSIVDFSLIPNAIPEGPLPREWQEQFIRE